MQPLDLTRTYLHLVGETDVHELAVTDDFWERIQERTDLHQGRLVVRSVFGGDWSTWEVHPAGEELVTLLSGELTFLLEQGGAVERVTLSQVGDTVIVPRGVWHTADVPEAASALFVTPGAGTQHRPREK